MTLSKEMIKDKGYHLTPKRTEILKAIDEAAPLTAEEILMKVRQQCRVNLSTIYRNINILLEMGLIRKVLLSEGHADQYEIVNHQCKHLVECVHCGATVAFSECLFNQMIKVIETQTNFQIKHHHLEVYGVCPQCKDNRLP